MINFFILKIIYYLIFAIITLVPILLSVAYFVLFERKGMGSIQRRSGPSNIGIYGCFQTIADAGKLLTKEISIPFKSNFFFFFFSPVFSFFISLLCWITIPFNYNNFFIDFNYSALLIFVINSFSLYSLILPGISSYSKYTVLGSFRALAQFISYEIILSFIFLFILLVCSSFNIIEIVLYQQLNIFLFIPLFPLSIIFFIGILAETNRAPFDLPEAESELVSGYSTEYSAAPYVMFFLAEYANMILWSFLFVFFFLGGWTFPFFSSIKLFFFKLFKVFFYIPNLFKFFIYMYTYIIYNFSIIIFLIKVLFINFLFILVRAAIPRYRFDSLLYIAWKVFLPFLLGYYIFIYFILLISNFI